jgi:methyl-accepting chemotaxis protein
MALKAAENHALAVARSESARIKSEIEMALDAGRTLAQTLSAAKQPRAPLQLDRQAVNAMLKQVLVSNPQFVGTYTLWEPNAFDGQDAAYIGAPGHDGTGRYIPYWSRSKTGQVEVEPLRHYEIQGPGNYYQVSKNTGQEVIITPHLYPVQGVDTWITSLVAPIVVGEQFYGVTGIDLRLEFLQEQADAVNLYDGTATLLLISYDGTLAGATGQPELVGQHIKTVHESWERDMTYVQEGWEGIEKEKEFLEVFVPIEVGHTTTPWSANLNIPMKKIAAEATAAMSLMIGIGVALVVLAVAALWFLARQITHPIQEITQVAQAVSDGNLEVKARVKSADETGLLAGAFNRMIVRLRQMLHQEQKQREHLQSTIDRYVKYMEEIAQGKLATRLRIIDNEDSSDDLLVVLGHNMNETVAGLQLMVSQTRDAANALSSAAAQILSASSEQAAGASEQSAAIAQTATTVDEVKVIAEQSVVRAQQVADTAQRSVQVSRAGREAVLQTIASMGEIKVRVEGIAENILALSEQTQQIGEIIASVNDIAAQSNMLALNASIEAARAGEHGKGFAVVAVEVRNLAEQSRQATAQVKAILSDIQRATNATVMVTEEGTKGVDEGVRLAAQTQAVIEQLSGAIDESAQVAMQVVAGGQQQASGVEQVAQAMQSIHHATAQSLSSTRQTEKAARELNDLARSLIEIVDQYRLA